MLNVEVGIDEVNSISEKEEVREGLKKIKRGKQQDQIE